jgi:aspartate/methionine/tyrosine aminotransferase
MAGIDLFQMERMQSLYWHLVEYDLSESGVTPMSIRELLGPAADAEAFVSTKLGYPLSEGAEETRANIAAWYPGATAEHVTLVNGGSEANLLVLWTLLDPDDRLAFMVPNYLQGWGLGRHFGRATDVFKLRLREGRWALDVDGLVKAVTKRTKVIMVCNPNNPTGAVLSEDEMDVIVQVAERANAWILADEIYRGAEVEGTEASPSFWGRTERVVITSGMSKAFGMPGLRSGWVVAPPELIRKVWIRHDYTTLTPNMVSDILTAFSMRPEIRETIFARTRGIIHANLPALERWIAAQGDLLTYVRPVAGAIAYMKYALPIRSTRLVDKIREEQSVLLVSGDMFGIGKGFRVGFGFDVEQTLKGLERVATVLAGVAGDGA